MRFRGEVGEETRVVFLRFRKKRSGPKFQYVKKSEVLGNTSVSKTQFFVDPNTLKYSILYYFRKLKYSHNTSKLLSFQTDPEVFIRLTLKYFVFWILWFYEDWAPKLGLSRDDAQARMATPFFSGTRLTKKSWESLPVDHITLLGRKSHRLGDNLITLGSSKRFEKKNSQGEWKNCVSSGRIGKIVWILAEQEKGISQVSFTWWQRWCQSK